MKRHLGDGCAPCKVRFSPWTRAEDSEKRLPLGTSVACVQRAHLAKRKHGQGRSPCSRTRKPCYGPPWIDGTLPCLPGPSLAGGGAGLAAQEAGPYSERELLAPRPSGLPDTPPPWPPRR